MAEAAAVAAARAPGGAWSRALPRMRRHRGAVVGVAVVAALALVAVAQNVVAPVIVAGTLGMGGAILAAAALSFIGLGSQPPTPEWGRMLSEGRDYLRDAWWISTFPGLAIMLTVLGVNMLGDGLRDVLDPRLRI